MTLRLGGDGAITGCTSLENPDLTVSGLTISGSFDAEKVLVASGTAAAPSYTFSGDTDNGLYYAGTNSIGLSTAGTNAILIDSSGNVGIGTSAPSQLLHLESAAPRIRLIDSDVSTGGQVSGSNGNLSLTYDVLGVGSKNFSISDSTSTRLTIDSSGRLLVGTTTSSGPALMCVQGQEGNSSAGAGISIRRGEVATDISSGEGIGNIYFEDNAGSRFASIFCQADANAGSGDYPGRLVFSTTADGASSPTERMRIDSSGNLGIGDTSPDTTLHIDSGAATTTIKISSNTESSVEFDDKGGSAKRYKIGTNISSNEGQLEFKDMTANVERMRIDSSGELLVGIANASNENVAINCPNLKAGSFFVGKVHDTTNSNDRTVLLHRIDSGSNDGFQFSGDFIVQSYTGNAFITVHITKKYTNNTVEVDVVQATSSAQISKTNVRVVTAIYGSSTYVGIQKNGGGTGTSSINAFVNGNIQSYGGIREVNNTSLGSVVEVAKLNY